MNFKMCSWKTKQEMKEKQEIFYETRRSLEELIVIVDGSTGIEQEDENKENIFDLLGIMACPAVLSWYVVRCTIWYHLYNLKIVESTHGRVLILGGVLILVKLQASRFESTGLIKSKCIHLEREEVIYSNATQWKCGLYM